eukprot:896588-Prymnesium_polylepis.1
MLVSGGAEAERGLVVYLRCKILAEMEVRKLIEGGTNGAQGDTSAAVPGLGKATPGAGGGAGGVTLSLFTLPAAVQVSRRGILGVRRPRRGWARRR